MSALPVWDPGNFAPPETMMADDRRAVTIALDPAVPRSDRVPAPILDAELSTWMRPSSAACFPIHDLGVLRLYSLAREILAGAGEPEDPEDLDVVRAQMWIIARRLFSPGGNIRARIEQAIESGWLTPKLEPEAEISTAQHARLAAWSVHRAALLWAKETSG